MTACTFIPILIALGGLLFGGLASWFWFRERLDRLSSKCETVESDNVILWNSYTSLQTEFNLFKEQAEKWKKGQTPKGMSHSRKNVDKSKRATFTKN